MQQNKFFRKMLGIMAAAIVLGTLPSCGSSSDDEFPDSNGNGGFRLASINDATLNYDENGKIVSVTTPKWGEEVLADQPLVPTLENGYLTKFTYTNGETLWEVAWSGGNPSSMIGVQEEFESKALAYGESCSSGAFCTAFNLFALFYPDNDDTSIWLGMFYGFYYNGTFGKNANRLITSSECYEGYGDYRSATFKFEKDANGNVTRIFVNTTAIENHHNEYKSSRIIVLTWEKTSGIDNVKTDKAPNKVRMISGMDTGRKANNLKDLPKGVYIVDGKKVVKSK